VGEMSREQRKPRRKRRAISSESEIWWLSLTNSERSDCQ
jgi:hypothetical protein